MPNGNQIMLECPRVRPTKAVFGSHRRLQDVLPRGPSLLCPSNPPARDRRRTSRTCWPGELGPYRCWRWLCLFVCAVPSFAEPACTRRFHSHLCLQMKETEVKQETEGTTLPINDRLQVPSFVRVRSKYLIQKELFVALPFGSLIIYSIQISRPLLVFACSCPC